jgi:transcriptional regulator with GAF, ATPase, and Fis domain
MHANPIPQNLQELQQRVVFTENVKRITNQIHAASDLDHILLDLRKEILSIFDAEDLTIFAFDSEKKEIFSKVPHIDSVEEFRIPITEQSLPGFCAKYLRPVSITDAYNIAELQGVHPALVHDTSYDKRTGFRTKQVLTYPIVADNKYLMGVLQLLNKRTAYDSQEKTKNPSRRLQRHSASPSSISAKSRRKPRPSSIAWLRTTTFPRMNWTMQLPSLGKAYRTSRAF